MKERLCAVIFAALVMAGAAGPAEAAMIEPLATAVHAVALAGALDGGTTAAILGGGSIGLSVLLAARAAGCGAVVVSEPVVAKRELAVELGAAAALDAAGDPAGEIRAALGGRPDVVFDCVGNIASVTSSIALADRGGRVVVVGVGHGDVPIGIETIQDHEVSVRGSAMYLPRDFDRAEELVSTGAAARLVTRLYPLHEIEAAFAAARSGQQVKVHITTGDRDR